MPRLAPAAQHPPDREQEKTGGRLDRGEGEDGEHRLELQRGACDDQAEQAVLDDEFDRQRDRVA